MGTQEGLLVCGNIKFLCLSHDCGSVFIVFIKFHTLDLYTTSLCMSESFYLQKYMN